MFNVKLIFKFFMGNAVYSLLGGVMRNNRELEVQANNAANMNSLGFSEDFGVYKTKTYRDVSDSLQMPENSPTVINFSKGDIKFTGRPLDVAITSENAFFKLNTPNGIRYSRAGNFSLDSENFLIDNFNNRVLTADGQEISFNEGDGTPDILADGTITINGEEREKIGMVSFNNPILLRKLGNGLYESEEPDTPNDDARLSQGALEQSNVKPVITLTRLTEIQQSESMIMAQINSLYSLERKAISVYGKIGG